ncbi:MAG: alpha/beta hydrolase [Actinomycetota bacterium]
MGSRVDTLLLLHGTGGNEDDLLPVGRMLDPEAILLSLRGRVLENGMPRFFRRLEVGVFDLEDLRVRTFELAGFVEDAVRAYGLDTTRIVAVGYSNGANIAASLLMLRPEVLAGAILLRPTLPFEPEERLPLAGKPILITAGRQDPYAPIDKTSRLAEIYDERGASVRLEWFPGGHELTQAELLIAQQWLRPNMLGGES